MWNQNIHKISNIVLVSALSVVGLYGCFEKQGYSVLAATGTVIGVEVSQNPATQTPQAKLGYNRGEFAFVPTNRDGGKAAGTSHNGASDSANVIMELRYGGIFDTGSTSGIYQRLAVGAVAVQEPGAAFMFAKDASGTLTDNTSQAVALTFTPQALADEQKKSIGAITKSVLKDDKTDNVKLKEFFKRCAGKDEATANRLATKYANLSKQEFSTALSKEYGPVAKSWQNNCNIN